MTRVLVVTDNERVQNVFEDLQNEGVLTLCTISNLMQSDEQIANFCPEFAFVQNRIAGLSGDIILRHLKKLLPPEGEAVLLALDPQDAALGRRQGARIVELPEAGEGLAQEITAVLQGEPRQLRKRKPTPPSGGTRRARAAKKGDAAEVEATIGDPAPATHSPEAASDATSAEEATGATPAPASFAEMMQRAEASALAGAGDVEDKVEVRSRSDVAPLTEPVGPLQETVASDGSEPRGWGGGGGRGPEHRSKRRPLWIFPLILAVILLPLLYLLPSQKNGAQRPELTPKHVAPKGVPAPAPLPPQSSAPVPQSKGAAEVAPSKPAAASPAAKPTPADQAAQDSQRRGLRELPQFLRGVTLDKAYAKGHPGWQRYIGARAEYKLYQEGGVYRALQVIALTGQTVPDEIFRKAMREFAGIDSYQLQSTERKQHFLVDHGRASGNIAVTVYRRINDRRVKGLVLYYVK